METDIVLPQGYIPPADHSWVIYIILAVMNKNDFDEPKFVSGLEILYNRQKIWQDLLSNLSMVLKAETLVKDTFLGVWEMLLLFSPLAISSLQPGLHFHCWTTGRALWTTSPPLPLVGNSHSLFPSLLLCCWTLGPVLGQCLFACIGFCWLLFTAWLASPLLGNRSWPADNAPLLPIANGWASTVSPLVRSGLMLLFHLLWPD